MSCLQTHEVTQTAGVSDNNLEADFQEICTMGAKPRCCFLSRKAPMKRDTKNNVTAVQNDFKN